ncbi:glycosyltransferase [Lactococcus lactis]|uniref:glycosyltransferase n=1 Tax=Lactococcus lactis TaxID=1358 RepID=UPI0022E5847F|nr:glycosyltransferase [Lactococcus lactis]
MISFVILNYNSKEEVCLAVSSIESKISKDYRIVIVDNYSPDNSGELLSKMYYQNKKIRVILNKKNYGFAKGMNIGFRNALEDKPDFIAIMNPDSQIETNDFDKVIEKIYSEHQFAAFGPDVQVCGTNIHQNPEKEDWISRKSVENKIKVAQSKLDHPYYALFRNRVANIINSNHSIKNNDYWKTAKTNVQLHGSFVVFSKKFFEWRDYAFDDNTFFYMELQILFYEMQKSGLKSYYSPELKVSHDKGSSTRQSYKDFFARNKFQNENLVKSCRYYLSVLDAYEK